MIVSSTGASLALLKAFGEQGGERVVMAGTCAEYDWGQGLCLESVTPRKPSTVYGTCKNALQEILSIYSNQFGLSSAWGRIFFLYGFKITNNLVYFIILLIECQYSKVI